MSRGRAATKNDALRAELQRIADEHGGHLALKTVVEEARDPKSVLHREFEWDGEKAAEAFLLIQAGALLRRIHIKVVTESKDPTRVNLVIQRAFPSVPSLRGSKEHGSYVPLDQVQDVGELVNEVLHQLKNLRKKHAALEQLSGVWKAVDEAVGE